MEHARLLGTEGEVIVQDWIIPEPLPFLRMAAPPRPSAIRYAMTGNLDTQAIEVDIIEFQLERRAGDGVLIYRRSSPLFR